MRCFKCGQYYNTQFVDDDVLSIQNNCACLSRFSVEEADRRLRDENLGITDSWREECE